MRGVTSSLLLLAAGVDFTTGHTVNIGQHEGRRALSAVEETNEVDMFYRRLDPAPGTCCGMCTQLLPNPDIVELLYSGTVPNAGNLNPLVLEPDVSITIKITMTYTDNKATDPTAIQSIVFDVVVEPADWNPQTGEACSYLQTVCKVFENDEIILFAPANEGGFAVLSLFAVNEFTAQSDVNIISSACDLVQAGQADIPFGTIQQSSFNAGFCGQNFFGRCPNGDSGCGDPHMQGLRGQHFTWSGVDGGWYSLIKDDNTHLDINVRVTSPLSDEFPDYQFMTGLAVLLDKHSLVIEVENPYTTIADGCPEGVSPCLANGGLRIIVDGQKVDELVGFSRRVPVADGAIFVSATNIPVHCGQFNGDKVWARKNKVMTVDTRQLRGGESLEEWILKYDTMAAPVACAKYIAENNLADLQSDRAIFKIETPTVTIRLNAGVQHQTHSKGKTSHVKDFWRMDIGLDGLDVGNPKLSGLLGETARPEYDETGKIIMEGSHAFRGTVKAYRVSSALGVHFPLLDNMG